MYLETYSMEELMELIEEKGYCSVEAVEILKEMEQAKKEYDFLLRDCEEKAWKTDQVVVDYYRHLLEELRKALPYDAMGGQHTIPILVLQEFRKQDIVEKIRNFIGCQAGFSDHDRSQPDHGRPGRAHSQGVSVRRHRLFPVCGGLQSAGGARPAPSHPGPGRSQSA